MDAGPRTMSPPPTASHAASTALPLAPESRPRPLVARAAFWLIEARTWTRARLVVDTVVLYIAAAAALFASPVHELTPDAVVVAIFPLLVLAILYARRSPDDRPLASRIDTTAHVLGVVSLAAMLTIALNSFLPGGHPVALAVRLWLFAVVYLSLARAMLVSIRRQAVKLERFATPTLIVGAGDRRRTTREAIDERARVRPPARRFPRQRRSAREGRVSTRRRCRSLAAPLSFRRPRKPRAPDT